jgi:hypothetical protein
MSDNDNGQQQCEHPNAVNMVDDDGSISRHRLCPDCGAVC